MVDEYWKYINVDRYQKLTDVELAFRIIQVVNKSFKEAGNYPKPTPQLDPKMVKMVSVFAGDSLYLRDIASEYILINGSDEDKMKLKDIMVESGVWDDGREPSA